MNIFIVEDLDSRNVREHVQIKLPDIPGIVVIGHALYDEQDVIERINALLPDVVILNFSRITEAIIYVLKRIKEHLAAIKVMVLANYSDEYYVDRCMHTGSDYFIGKVFPDEPSVKMRVHAFMQIRAALWRLVHTSALNDRLVVLH